MTYPELHDSHVVEYEFAVVYAVEDDGGEYPPYRPCCYCGEEDSPRDSFLDRFICTPCGLAEDDEVDAAERRSNSSRC